MSWGFAIETLVMFVEYLIIYVFYKNFAGQKKTNFTHYLIAAIACIIVVTATNQYGNVAVKAFTSISCFFLLTFLFDGNWKLKLFSVFLLGAFMITADAFSGFLVEWVSGVNLRNLTDGHILGFVCAFISKLILFVIVKVVCAVRNKNNTHLPLLYCVALASLPLISGFIIFGIYVSNKENAIDGSPLFFLIAFGLIFINGVVFQLFESLLEKTTLETMKKLMQQQIDAQIAQYNAVISEQQESNQLRHDMKGHIDVLYNLIESNHTKEALEYMRKIKEISTVDRSYVRTGNAVVDAVFNSKIRIAKEKGIRIENNGFIIPRSISLEPLDMCIIFANSLDNAIEACERIEIGDKYIRFGLVHRDGSITFKITNPTNGKLVKDKTRFRTSKKSDGHGIGLYNIEKALEKYDTTFMANHNGNVFELGFILPYKKKGMDSQPIKIAT